MIWKCQGPRGADINVCASLNPNPTAHRQLSPFIMGKITPELVNIHTAVCKAHFSCIQHLFEYLQLANKDQDLGLHTLSVEQQWKQRWAVARQDSLLSTMNSPPDHQTESRPCPTYPNSLGDDIPREKTNCNLRYWSLFFHLLRVLPSSVGTGEGGLKTALTIA